MKSFIIILLIGFVSVSFAESACLDSVVFVKKSNCFEMTKKEEVKEYTVMKGVLPAKTVIQQVVAGKMLVFASNTGQVYSATTSVSEVGIGKLGGHSVKFGLRTTF